MKTVVFDIGGTAVKYGVFAEDAVLFDQFPVRDADGNEHLPTRLCDIAKQLGANRIVISAPGPFDFENGTGQMRHKLPSLYGVSLRERFAAALPDVSVDFVHDLTAFAAGALAEYPDLRDTAFACVTLGTGLGYVFVQDGKAQLNDRQTPLHPLWNQPYEDGICEDYVSAAAFLREAEICGFSFDSVKALDVAAETELALQAVFDTVGKHLGECVNLACARDPFSCVVIGGQISRSWDRMRAAFAAVCDLPCRTVQDPATCALYGLNAIAKQGKDVFGTITT